MAKTELPIQLPWLTRAIHAMAALVGIGASLGLGISTLSLGTKLPKFVAENQLPLPARMTLLKVLLASMCAVPGIVMLATALRLRDPNRLQTFERVSSRLAPVAALGLLPMLLQITIWKDRLSLFLVATLVSTQIVMGVLPSLDFGRPGDVLARLLSRGWARMPRLLRGASPWVFLVVAVVTVILLGAKNSTIVAGNPAHRPPSDFVSAVRHLGHAGYLAVAHASSSPLASSAKASKFIYLAMTAAAAFPLYLWSRAKVGSIGALAIAVCYLSFPPLLFPGAALPLPLGTGALFFFLAAYAWEERKYVLGAISSIALVGIHEQLALWLVCLGVYLLARRRASARTTVPLVALAFGYFLVVALVLLPRFGVDPYGKGMSTLWAGSQRGLFTAIATVFANPAHALVRFAEQREIVFWLLILVPLALIPFRGRLWLLWFAPFLWCSVVFTGRLPGTSLNIPGVGHLVVLGFAAQLLALEQLRARDTDKAQFRAVLGAWIFALVPCVHQSGCLWLSPP